MFFSVGLSLVFIWVWSSFPLFFQTYWQQSWSDEWCNIGITKTLWSCRGDGGGTRWGDKTEEPREKISGVERKGSVCRSVIAPLSVLAVGYAGFNTQSLVEILWLYAMNVYRWTGAVDQDYQSIYIANVCQCRTALMDIMGSLSCFGSWLLLSIWRIIVSLFRRRRWSLIWKRSTPSPMQEKFFSLNPIVEFVKSLMKLFLLGYIVWKIVGNQWTTFPTLLKCTYTGFIFITQNCLGHLWDVFRWSGIAIFDFGYQWYDNRKNWWWVVKRSKLRWKIRMGIPRWAQQRKRANSDYRQPLVKDSDRLMWLSLIQLTSPLLFDMTNQRRMPYGCCKGCGFPCSEIDCWQISTNTNVENPPFTWFVFSNEGHQIHPDFCAAVAEVLAMIYRRRQQHTNLLCKGIETCNSIIHCE